MEFKCSCLHKCLDYMYIMLYTVKELPQIQMETLTLALCKKDIRRCTNPGDIIIGLVSKGLGSSTKERVGITENSLCFFAKIDEKLSFEQYAKKCQCSCGIGFKG